MDNGSEQLLTKIRDMRLIIGGETVLKGVKHIHDIEDAAIVRIALRGRVPTAVSP